MALKCRLIFLSVFPNIRWVRSPNRMPRDVAIRVVVGLRRVKPSSSILMPPSFDQPVSEEGDVDAGLWYHRGMRLVVSDRPGQAPGGEIDD